jgi:hypothetical protein
MTYSNYLPTGGVNSGLTEPTTAYGRYSPATNRQNLGQYAPGQRISNPNPTSSPGGALAPLAQAPPQAMTGGQFANQGPFSTQGLNPMGNQGNNSGGFKGGSGGAAPAKSNQLQSSLGN